MTTTERHTIAATALLLVLVVVLATVLVNRSSIRLEVLRQQLHTERINQIEQNMLITQIERGVERLKLKLEACWLRAE